jgi:hypothetical protein
MKYGESRLISACHANCHAHELTWRHAADGADRLSPSWFDASVDLNPRRLEAEFLARLFSVEDV